MGWRRVGPLRDQWVDRPPLLLLIFKAADWFGGSAVTLRLFALAFAAVTIASAWWAGKVINGPKGAVASALVAAMVGSEPQPGRHSPHRRDHGGCFRHAGLCSQLQAKYDAESPQTGVLLALVAGMFAASALLVKQSFVDAGVFACVLLGIKAHKTWRLMLAGAVGVAVPLFVRRRRRVARRQLVAPLPPPARARARDGNGARHQTVRATAADPLRCDVRRGGVGRHRHCRSRDDPHGHHREDSDEMVAGHLKAASQPTDSVVVAYGTPSIIESSGLTTPYRYSWSLPIRGRDPHLTQLLAVLRGPQAPTWHVEMGSFDWWGIDTPDFRQVRHDRYRWVAHVCGHNVYLRDDVRRKLPPIPLCTAS